MTMTDEQVSNFRRVLFRIYGPVALYCSRDVVVAYRDKLQFAALSAVDSIEDKTNEALYAMLKKCLCDRSFHSSTTHVDGRVECNNCHKDR